MALALARTKDGHPAIKIRHITLAMIRNPRTGNLQVYTAYPSKDPAELDEKAFSPSSPEVANENEFAAHAQDLIDHYNEVDRLNRVSLDRMIPTPWGASQQRTHYAEGIESVSCAGHGGFLLDAERNAKVDPSLRISDGVGGGSYEEDCDWAIVAFTFPDLFTARERMFADKTIRNWRPDEYQVLTGIKLTLADSHVLAEREFKEATKDKFVVVSAVNSTDRPGFVECTATVGGHRRFNEASKFYVPSVEYAERSGHGFIIDESRHARMSDAPKA